jgi:Terminase large subunit, T4likevirus-type, N-terminal
MLANNEVEIDIEVPELHPKQHEIANSNARFRVVVCGRRWGKTRVGAYLALLDVMQGKRIWWVAPVYSQAMLAWRLLKPLFQQIPGAEIRESERCIKISGGELWIKSADNRDNLRGEGLDGVVIDEADYTNEQTWTQALRPALADRRGWALFISTPREQGGWFEKAYNRGQGDDPLWASWQYPSWTNPFLDPAELDDARRDMSELEYRQEFGAEFVGIPDAVYHNWDPKLHIETSPFSRGLQTIVGLDFNNTPRVAVFLQQQPDKSFRAVGEVYHPYQATTEEHAAMVANWFISRGVSPVNKKFESSQAVCIADASGAAKQHTGKSDHEAFKALFSLDVPNANPAIRDRDNAVLSYLKNAKGEVRIKVDPSCKHLIEAFQKFKHVGRDRSPWGHILDAFGYVIHRRSAQRQRTEREVA